MIQQIKETIKVEVKKALTQAGYELPAEFGVVLENTKDPAHGDFATNAAMQLTKLAKKNPRMIAEDILSNLDKAAAHIEKAEIAGPGFINFFMDKAVLTQAVNEIIEKGAAYGKMPANGKTYNIEYVSANPTGDLHLGHARGAAIGDSVCRIMEAAGYTIAREYYVNDAGNQIHNLTLSVHARYMEALGEKVEFPEEGYRGADIEGFGRELAEKYGEQFKDFDAHAEVLRQMSVDFQLDKLKKDLADFGVEFDLYTSEQALYDDGSVATSLTDLEKAGFIYEQEGAKWLRTTDFGDDKDRVLQKSDGSYTYLTPDIANHIKKIERGNDKLVNLWGADHHGYIARVKAGLQSLGYSGDILEVDIIQMVRLIKDGAEFKMSKRTGKAVTMRELVEDVGLDATRYFFASRSADSPMDFDVDLAKSQSNENPVYYVQYAHARACTLLKRAAENGIEPARAGMYPTLTHEKEQDVIKLMGDFPATILDSANKRKPHIITNYVHDLVAAFHSLYGAKKIIDSEDVEGTKERLALVEALGITIENALNLIGVSAPESM